MKQTRIKLWRKKMLDVPAFKATIFGLDDDSLFDLLETLEKKHDEMIDKSLVGVEQVRMKLDILTEERKSRGLYA